MSNIIFLDVAVAQCIEVNLFMSIFVPSKSATQSALRAKTHISDYTLGSRNFGVVG